MAAKLGAIACRADLPSLPPDVPRIPGIRQTETQPAVSRHPAAEILGLSRGHTRTASARPGRASYALRRSTRSKASRRYYCRFSAARSPPLPISSLGSARISAAIQPGSAQVEVRPRSGALSRSRPIALACPSRGRAARLRRQRAQPQTCPSSMTLTRAAIASGPRSRASCRISVTTFGRATGFPD